MLIQFWISVSSPQVLVKERKNRRHIVLLWHISMCVLYHKIDLDAFSDFQFHFRQQETCSKVHTHQWCHNQNCSSQSKIKIAQENIEILDNWEKFLDWHFWEQIQQYHTNYHCYRKRPKMTSQNRKPNYLSRRVTSNKYPINFISVCWWIKSWGNGYFSSTNTFPWRFCQLFIETGKG